MSDEIQLYNPERDAAYTELAQNDEVRRICTGVCEHGTTFPHGAGYYEVWCQAWSKAWDIGFEKGIEAARELMAVPAVEGRQDCAEEVTPHDQERSA